LIYDGQDFYCDRVIPGLTLVEIVMETPQVLAFHHTQPTYPVHVVVIPKEHVPSFLELGKGREGLLQNLLDVVRAVAAEVLQTHGSCRIQTNLGRAQTSKHLHFHVYCDEGSPGKARLEGPLARS
jgi:histidine triad (HIT) family protein